MPIAAIANTRALRNIRSKENEEGNDSVIPLMLTNDWFVCIYIAAKAGPIDDPTILNIVLIPIVTPVNSIGVASIVTFTAPTEARERPVDNIAKPMEIESSVEWNNNNTENPAAVRTVPKIIGFIDPSFEIINPEVGPNIKRLANWPHLILLILIIYLRMVKI